MGQALASAFALVFALLQCLTEEDPNKIPRRIRWLGLAAATGRAGEGPVKKTGKKGVNKSAGTASN
jgi:hypothetical protein